MEPTADPIASTSTLPTQEEQPAPVSFEDLGIEPFLVRALRVMSIRKPTTVQAACIPPILAGKSFPWTLLRNGEERLTARPATLTVETLNTGSDCIGSAQTGSGKTVAFAIPILQALARDPYGFFALVLTPTRCATLTVQAFT